MALASGNDTKRRNHSNTTEHNTIDHAWPSIKVFGGEGGGGSGEAGGHTFLQKGGPPASPAISNLP